MKNKIEIKKIVLTGPESTGKTTLASYLSETYNSIFFPEFARGYIENLNRDYTFTDVEKIAKHQICLLEKDDYDAKHKFVFFDTGLIITKIWFQEVYGFVPDYINSAIEKIKIDLYLLCFPDIVWVPDTVRENGGDKRIYLFNKYKEELERNNFKYFIIRGERNKRFALAKEYLSSAYCL